jgi:hypothetical protein
MIERAFGYAYGVDDLFHRRPFVPLAEKQRLGHVQKLRVTFVVLFDNPCHDTVLTDRPSVSRE